MTQDQFKKIAIKVTVTFLEAAVAYLSLTGWNVTSKTALAGAVGAGLSAVYNFAKHYVNN